jgi:primosomal protein N' (replication factor Y) (superfamily II helicase)
MSTSVSDRLKVALPLPLPQLFDYLPPPGEAADAGWIGCRVRVGFGPRRLVGVVAALGPPEAARPRAVEQRLDAQPVFDAELWHTLNWAAGYYQRALGEVLFTALPAWLREGREPPQGLRFGWRRRGGEAAADLRAGGMPERLWKLLDPVRDEAALDLLLPGWRAAARSLARRGLIERLPLQDAPGAATPGPSLNHEQAAAVDAVRAAGTGFASFLLDGVTGSGKTEVYLRLVEDCLARGRQALVLVPEIGLTPQTRRRFAERLPATVHVLHSELPDGERARVHSAFARGEGRVLLGTRSAVFTPLPQAGLILVDEEHDLSYKQQEGFRYSARDLALVRGKALGVPVLLGSATPSLESLHQVELGRCHRLRLGRRATGASAPKVEVLDVRRKALRDGLVEPVFERIAAALARAEQVLVFRNRRGFAPVLLCHDCGWSARCTRCEAPMTVHARGRRLICHHCGARAPVPPACPACEGLALMPQGAGTERLEQGLAERFPDARLVRIDRDTTQGRDGFERRLAELGEAPGILVGTQMLAKGHDLPRLSLVVVCSVDEGLFSVDFRASERLAQLLIQVAGRAGRADRPGTVLLQTHHPEHPLLHTLLTGGYPAFAAEALAERRAARFPPYWHLALLRVESPQAAALDDFLAAARRLLGSEVGGFGTGRVQAFGPMPAPMPLREGRLRGQLLLSATDRAALQPLLRRWVPQLHALPEARAVRWSLDVDPVDLY